MWGIILYYVPSPTLYLASVIGTAEPATKIIISLLMTYLIAIVYDKFITKYIHFRNIYFIAAGFDIAYYNFGFNVTHIIRAALVMFCTTHAFGPGKTNVIVTCIYNMTYLVVGYISTGSDNYDIVWTTPFCLVTLKLIALSFDLWDGQNEATRCKPNALRDPPTLMELLGFVFFPACFLVGPLISFKRYLDYNTDKFPLDTEAAVYQKQAFRKLLQGLLYLTAFQVTEAVFNIKYMLSDDFLETSIFYRHLYCGMWGHFMLYKYIACWLLAEAACIRFGLSYNGRDEDSVSRWDGCNNIKLVRFESATKFQHYVRSFNCNTNHFAAEYIYKRLKFLGNRHLSQLFTLLFLSLWHGTSSGYYMTFFNEFIITYMERDLGAIVSSTQLYHDAWANGPAKCVMYLLLKLYIIVFMGWSLVPFDMKVFSKWWHVYSSLYFSGFLVFLPWPFVYRPLLKYTLKKLNVANVKTE